MFQSILIIIASSALFCYWFRYTCLLALGQRSSADNVIKIAAIIRLSFPAVQEELQNEVQTSGLERLYESLDHDYQVLTDLLYDPASRASLDRRLLIIDYKAMKLWYKLTRATDLLMARKALEEMSLILCYFADAIGQGTVK